MDRPISSLFQDVESGADPRELFVPAIETLRTSVPLDYVSLLACEENRAYVREIARYLDGIGPGAVGEPRPSVEVAVEWVSAYPGGLPFVPAEAPTPAAQEIASSGMRSAIVFPLQREGVTYGLITFCRRDSECFDEEEIRALVRVAESFALGFVRRADLAARDREIARRDLVTALCQWPDTSHEPSELIEAIAPLLSRVVPFDFLQVALSGEVGEYQVIYEEPDFWGTRGCTRIWEDLQLREAIRQGRDVVAYQPADSVTPVRRRSSRAGIAHMAVVLLRHQDEVLGLLGLGRRGRVGFDEGELSLLGVFGTELSYGLQGRKLRVRLAAAEGRYQRMFADAPVMAVLTDDDRGRGPVIEDCNELFLTTLGFERDEVVGWPLERFYTPDSRRELLSTGYRRALRQGIVGEERELVAAGGNIISALLRATPRLDDNGTPVGTLAMFVDITERKALQLELAHRAFHDPLTDLPNRALFADRVQHALERRSGPNHVAVALIDLDDFKVVNDTLGHGSGDDLLAAVGERLRGALPARHTLARLGGDEFAVLLEDISPPEDAAQTLATLLQALGAAFDISGRPVVVDASVGLAFADFPTRPSTPEELLRQADLAMYEAKRQGKGIIQPFHTELEQRVTQRMEIAHELRRAIEREELEVHYQPIVDLATGALTELEALVRWVHPVRGLISACDFIDVAEQTGLVIPLGSQVLRSACRAAREWIDEGLVQPDFKVSVNLSVKQLERESIVQEVLATLQETQLEPGRLKLEVTEGTLLSDPERAVTRLKHLRDAGISIAIDDFGTGYSSLDYLKHLPVDTIKVDRSFVLALSKDHKDTAIVRAVVAFAGEMGLIVTGEGVETEAQRRELKAVGCDRAQGYYFGRAVPVGAVADLLQTLGRRVAA